MSPDDRNPELPPDADSDDERVRGVAGILPDVVRRAVMTGMGALFMTEEGIRNMVGELKLPKDALAFLVAQADKTRTEVARVVTQEVRRFLGSETMRNEVIKILSSVTLEVTAQIKLKPSGEPDLSGKVNARRDQEPGEADKA